jgi:hypothetical protein
MIYIGGGKTTMMLYGVNERGSDTLFAIVIGNSKDDCKYLYIKHIGGGIEHYIEAFDEEMRRWSYPVFHSIKT